MNSREQARLEEPEAARPWRTHETCRATQVVGGQRMGSVDTVVEEVPVALVYNGVSHAVMLATPADIEDFALGFSLCEGIVTSPREIYDVEVAHCAQGIEARIELAAERFMALKARRRSLAGRTGCGLCGVDSLDAAVRPPAVVSAAPQVGDEAIMRALARLPERQVLHGLTGGAHAAAWADLEGNVLLAREDVGRHNALDKLIGALARRGVAPGTGFVAVTSRASYEMVQKVAAFGAGLLVAVSAPTAYAVRMAQEANITLVGFARAGRLTFYSNRQG